MPRLPSPVTTLYKDEEKRIDLVFFKAIRRLADDLFPPTITVINEIFIIVPHNHQKKKHHKKLLQKKKKNKNNSNNRKKKISNQYNTMMGMTTTTTTKMIIIVIIIINNMSPSIGSKVSSKKNSKRWRSIVETKSGKSMNINNSYYEQKSLEKYSKSNKSENISSTYFSTRTPTKNPTGKPSDSLSSVSILSDITSTMNIKIPTESSTVLALPTSSPTDNNRGACEDSNTFHFNNEKDKDCATWVSIKPIKRCKRNDPVTGKMARYFCPNICKTKCKSKLAIVSPSASPLASPTTSPSDDRGECEDSNTFRFNNKLVKNCNTWVSVKPIKRCKKNDSATGKKVRYFCPTICKPKCKSKSPIVSPSASPSTTPTTSPSDNPGECEDSNTFRFNNELDKNCATWVSLKPIKRCKKNDSATGKKVRYFCPNICKRKCKFIPSWVSISIMDGDERTAYLSALVDLVFGLYQTLSAAGPYTVFAPTNTAFLESLFSDGNSLSADQVSSILTYHVVEGIYTGTDLKDGLILTTLQGDTLKFESSGFVNGEKIIVPNIPATIGIVHFIDGVLIPKG
jgi:hypothetical protein